MTKYHGEIFAYAGWPQVLEALHLAPVHDAGAEAAVEMARAMQGGGEGEAHRRLKDLIYQRPNLVGAPAAPAVRRREFPIPSGDRLDVYFEAGRKQIAVEVKASISGDDDIARGLFQCVKYEAVLTKWRAWQTVDADIRVILALGGALPPSLLGLCNALRVCVVDGLEGR